MRLVCPKCVAQYEVADGTIPDSGRDVQCANCNHVWFQDAAFKLSTDDLTHVPQKLRAADYDEDDDDGADDTPGVFLSKRAPQISGAPTEAVERTMPEVGNNVLDILRSEAAFSSRRRAARVGPAQPQPEPDKSAPDIEDGAESSLRRIGTRAGDIPPAPEPEDARPDPAQRATDDIAEEPGAEAPEADFRKLNWRHMGGSQPGGWAPAGPDSAAFLREDPEPEHDVTGLAADEAKRIAEAAVARSEQARRSAEPDEPPHISAEEAEEQDREFRQAIRRVSVRSLADPVPAEEESTTTPPRDPIRHMPKVADLRAVADEDDGAEEALTATKTADDILPEDDAGELTVPEAEDTALEETLAAADAEEDSDAGTADEEQEADETEPALTPITDPDDIRQVRLSLVENRKVLLPDVDELNTSLRMENGGRDVDLRSSAFSEEDAAANRNRFWLGLVTALMLFGILSALYLMGPAISDTFPAADPYVAAYRDMADSALGATANAWVPVVDWLESL